MRFFHVTNLPTNLSIWSIYQEGPYEGAVAQILDSGRVVAMLTMNHTLLIFIS